LSELIDRVTRSLRNRFGRSAVFVARAPGRVNLIGEHTDYNQGLVLPCAIDRETVVAAASREDGLLRVAALDLEAEVTLPLAGLGRRGDWSDYVAAPAWSLAEAGVHCAGADLALASRVPRESGLSSSAALGVAVVRALAALAGSDASAQQLADIAWNGECTFVGVGCGILDPYAAALGREGHALRIDCRDRSVVAVPLGDAAVFLIAQSGVTRALASGGYRDRVAECAQALAQAKEAGIASDAAESLRVLDVGALDALEAALEDRPFRRARHVLTENARVDAFHHALAGRDLAAAGAILDEGMRSLRRDYEVSVPELDALCDIANAHPACHGSRLTGAGWGGCTVHLVERDGAAEVATAIDAGFAKRFGRSARVLTVKPSDGASVVPA